MVWSWKERKGKTSHNISLLRYGASLSFRLLSTNNYSKPCPVCPTSLVGPSHPSLYALAWKYPLLLWALDRNGPWGTPLPSLSQTSSLTPPLTEETSSKPPATGVILVCAVADQDEISALSSPHQFSTDPTDGKPHVEGWQLCSSHRPC